MKAVALCLLAALAPRASAAEEPSLALSIDPHVSIETGSDLTSASVRLLARVEAIPLRPLAARPALGIPARAARALLLDLPVAWWFGVLEHEAFGHGGRARELGARATFHMGSPWGGRDSYASISMAGLTNDELLRISAGGSEANGWTATLLERSAVSGAPMSSLELLFLASNRYVTSRYVLRTTPNPATRPAAFWAEMSGGGDVANYLRDVSLRATGEAGITPTGSSPLVLGMYRRLRRQAVWNELDPGAWLALLGAARAVLAGDEPRPLPAPRIAGRRFLPVLSADWLPDGGVASLELVLGPSPAGAPGDRARWSSLTLRRGRGPRGGFGAIGVASERIASSDTVRIGGEAEIWSRPHRSLGGGARARLTAERGRLRHLFLEAGVKSAGAWPGRPAAPGAFLRAGIVVPLD